MKDMKRTIVFRAKVKIIIFVGLFLLLTSIYVLTSANTLSNPLQQSLIILSATGILLTGLLAFFHYMVLDDFKIIESIMASSKEAVVITDKHNRIVFVNERYLDITRSDYESVLGKDPGHFKSGVHTASFYEAMWKDIKENRYWRDEVWDKRSDGKAYPKELTIRTIGGRPENPRYHIGVFSDLSTYKTLNNRQVFDRYFFAPTELPNENRIKQFMRQNIAKEKSFQLHYIRITNYSYLISTHSPEGFFGAIRKVTERIKAMKESVVMGQIDRETLLLIREGPYREQSFEDWLKLLNQAFENPVASLMKFDVRTGVALCPEHDDDPEGLLTKATLAFDHTYMINTRNHAIYDDTYHKMISEEYTMRDDIISGLSKGEFSLVYHPICTGEKSKNLYGVEALLRWHSKTHGNVPPETFIPIAEKYFLMNRLGNFVVKEALKHKAMLDEAFGKGIVMSINTSATQYRNEVLYQTMSHCMRKRSVTPGEVIVEITESSIMVNLEETIDYLTRLGNLGVKIALDDFGTGFSSLSYLRTMPIHFVKIDREFVRGYPENDDGTLARTIIKIGNDLNLQVIAEGVETEKQANMLASYGCHLFQGYYFTRPLEFDRLLSYVRDHCDNHE